MHTRSGNDPPRNASSRGAEAKKQAAAAALCCLTPGQVVGLGTGTTVKYLVLQLADRPDLIRGTKFVHTSWRTHHLAAALGIDTVEPGAVKTIDLCIDGADEIATNGDALKGGGGCLLWEKIVARKAAANLLIIHDDKLVPRLGGFPIAVEIVAFDADATAAHVAVRLGAVIGRRPVMTRRMTPGRVPFESDSGNAIFDLRLPMDCPIEQPAVLSEAINGVLGVVDNGIFPAGCYDYAIVADASGPFEFERGRRGPFTGALRRPRAEEA